MNAFLTLLEEEAAEIARSETTKDPANLESSRNTKSNPTDNTKPSKKPRKLFSLKDPLKLLSTFTMTS